MTIKTQGLQVISGAVLGKKGAAEKRKSNRLWSEQINPDSVMRRSLSGKVPAVDRAGSSAEEDPTSVKVKYTLQQHLKATLH